MKQIIYLILLSLFFSCSKPEVLIVKEDIKNEQELTEEVKDESLLDSTVIASIPHIYINTHNSETITSKDDYLKGVVWIKANGKNNSLFEKTMRIKGRGNSTWLKPKKPYRIKLDEAASVLGLAKAKDWVLLANHQDYTYMTNAIAMKLGQQLNMPFTNNIIAVDVTINDVYQGLYNLTEQIEVKTERINIGDDGVLLELDSYFDEDYKFKSARYQLPVNIKSPDVESEEQFNIIKNEFENLEELIYDSSFPNNNYGNLIDKQQLVNYLLVSNLIFNREIIHPKSVYMHKQKGGKYTMGPIWDFDWAFGYNENEKKYFNAYDGIILNANNSNVGSIFWRRLLSDPEIKKLYKSTWNDYKRHMLKDLLNYCDYFAARIRNSQPLDHNIWKVGSSDLAKHKLDMKNFLKNRAIYMDNYIKEL